MGETSRDKAAKAIGLWVLSLLSSVAGSTGIAYYIVRPALSQQPSYPVISSPTSGDPDLLPATKESIRPLSESIHRIEVKVDDLLSLKNDVYILREQLIGVSHRYDEVLRRLENLEAKLK